MIGMPRSCASRTVIWLRDFSMPKRSVVGSGRSFLLVVLRLPDVLAGTLIDLDRSVEDDRRRLVAVVYRGRIDEGLERRAGLALGLDRAIELAHVIREAAGDGEHATRVGVHRDDAAADLRDLHQRPDAAECCSAPSARRRRRRQACMMSAIDFGVDFLARPTCAHFISSKVTSTASRLATSVPSCCFSGAIR